MENKETMTCKINGVVEKKSKAGRLYHSIETDKGNFSCFEYDIAMGLKEKMGEQVSLEIATSENGNFKNVRGVNDSKAVNLDKIPEQTVIQGDKFVDAREAKNQSIYTSYAKDLFIARILSVEKGKEKEAMELCINLVKQAKEAFA